jgi:hypothetical protein
MNCDTPKSSIESTSGKCIKTGSLAEKENQDVFVALVTPLSDKSDVIQDSPSQRTRPFYSRKSKLDSFCKDSIGSAAISEDKPIKSGKDMQRSLLKKAKPKVATKDAVKGTPNNPLVFKCSTNKSQGQGQPVIPDSNKATRLESNAAFDGFNLNCIESPDWTHIEPSLDSLISSDINSLLHLYLYN